MSDDFCILCLITNRLEQNLTQIGLFLNEIVKYPQERGVSIVFLIVNNLKQYNYDIIHSIYSALINIHNRSFGC